MTLSVFWVGRSPSQSSSTSSSSLRPQWNSKKRFCLPPLQPLSIARLNIEEWPKLGSDDLEVWANPTTLDPRPPKPTTTHEDSGIEKPLIEFKFHKDKLAFFNKECYRIVDQIYLGSDTVAESREVLCHYGITHVLNCVGFLCLEHLKNDLVYKTLWLHDNPSKDITGIFMMFWLLWKCLKTRWPSFCPLLPGSVKIDFIVHCISYVEGKTKHWWCILAF